MASSRRLRYTGARPRMPAKLDFASAPCALMAVDGQYVVVVCARFGQQIDHQRRITKTAQGRRGEQAAVEAVRYTVADDAEW